MAGPMVRAVVVAAAAVGLHTLACSLVTSTTGLTGGQPPRESDGSTPDADEGGPADAGLDARDCAWMGPLSATSVSDDGTGSCSWSPVPGALKENDGLVAACTLPQLLQSTSGLFVAGFGFTVPASATVVGVRATVLGRENAPIGSDLTDHSVRLRFGIERGADRSGRTWPTEFTPRTFGGDDDLWNMQLTPAKVNDPAFGFEIAATSQGLAAVTAQIDAIALSVYYCQ